MTRLADMTIAAADFPARLLTAPEEVALAQQIEAGVFAEHLLAAGDARWPARDLHALVTRGRSAWERLWLANLRLVVKLAHAQARRHHLPLDDLFQDGCVGLADAMLRFDAHRGLRFSTLAHEYVHRAVTASAVRRCGAADGPSHGHRVRAQLRLAAAATPGADKSLRSLARVAGVPLRSATTSSIVFCALDDVSPTEVQIEDDLDAVERVPADFLDLIPGWGELLRRRFGLGRPATTQAELAGQLGMSTSSLARLEVRALERARALLVGDEPIRARTPLPSLARA